MNNVKNYITLININVKQTIGRHYNKGVISPQNNLYIQENWKIFCIFKWILINWFSSSFGPMSMKEKLRKQLKDKQQEEICLSYKKIDLKGQKFKYYISRKICN